MSKRKRIGVGSVRVLPSVSLSKRISKDIDIAYFGNVANSILFLESMSKGW